jgi:hypothetical protein
MTEAAFYLDRMQRSLKRAHMALGRGDDKRARAYELASRHYRSACMIASGRASAIDEVLELLQCEVEALTYATQYEDTVLRPGVVHALALLIKHRDAKVNYNE